MDQLNFKISSRATILLGRENVSSATGALIELIKNTYDADANNCLVIFEDNSIYIIDDGIGMNMDTIKNNWMMIGTENKKYEYVSKKGRMRSGEKGIGRFALDRLGVKCEMYTKEDNKENKIIQWKMNWSEFEKPGKMLEDIKANINTLNGLLKPVLPNYILSDLERYILDERLEEVLPSFDTGTIIKISDLRDRWTDKEITKIGDELEFLIPPAEMNDFNIYLKKSILDDFQKVRSEFSDDYDYKMNVSFSGESFNIKLFRNEFDMLRFDKEFLLDDKFSDSKYSIAKFDNNEINNILSISQLMNTNDKVLINKIKSIGQFNFTLKFAKRSANISDREKYFLKKVSRNRTNWLKQYSGIRIYRDEFLVRPYGIIDSDMHDWLNLDARNASNPVPVSRKGWTVLSGQTQGFVVLSRVFNEVLQDKSNREGLIESEYFTVFKSVIIKLISFMEEDRSFIFRELKKYNDKKNEVEKAKKDALVISKKSQQHNKKLSSDEIEKNYSTLTKSVLAYKEEVEDLTSEIKLLRALASTGLMTATLAHDLSGITNSLNSRYKNIKYLIEKNETDKLIDFLEKVHEEDKLISSWIMLSVEQTKRDKRKRKKKSVKTVIENLIGIFSNITDRMNIVVNFDFDDAKYEFRIFESDFESIIYNLLINSIEAFTHRGTGDRIINMKLQMQEDDSIMIVYKDTGPGIDSDIFGDRYSVFDFGKSSKVDADGNQYGTGLGMYIIASTINDYGGGYELLNENGFGLSIQLPLKR